MAFSYSFHLGGKSHSINRMSDLQKVSKHNLRKFKTREADNIVVLRGSSESIVSDVARIYHEEFDEAISEFNNGVPKERQIQDYLSHVEASKYDMAAEVIIQVGDMDFWANISAERQKEILPLLNAQIEKLEELAPNFKVVSAVAHFDESSPHLHIVGIPISEDYKKGLKKRVSKRKVFTRESLQMLQKEMRKAVAIEMQKLEIFQGLELKEKEKGRNKDIPKHSLEAYNEHIALVNELEHDEAKKVEKINELIEYYNSLVDAIDEAERSINISREISL